MNKEERTELINEEVRLDLNPILDLFGGADGGVGFTKLRHKFLPDIYQLDSEQARHMKRVVKQFSNLCKTMMLP